MDDEDDLAPDGFPKYYSKKPRGEWYVYHTPAPPEVQKRKMERMKETVFEQQRREIAEWVFVILSKLFDSMLLRIIIVGLPVSFQFAMVFSVTLNHTRMRTALFFWNKSFQTPITACALHCMYYPLLIWYSFQIYFLFDDKIAGPMFRHPFYQRLHVNFRSNFTSLINNLLNFT